MHIRCLILPIMALAGIIFCSSLAAAGFIYSDATAQSQPFRPGHFALDEAGAYVVGNANARFNADGTLAFLTSYFGVSGDTLVARTQDGGMIQGVIPFFGTPQQLACSLRKSGADGRFAWSETIDAGGFCDALIVDADGTIWIFTLPFSGGPGALYRILADGTGLQQISFPNGSYARFIATDPNRRNLYAVGFLGDPASGTTVVKFNPDSSIAWQYSDTSMSAILDTAGIDAAGNVVAAGRQIGATEDSLMILSVSASGAPRWSKHYSDISSASSLMGIAVSADGTSYALVPKTNADFPVVVKTGADGTPVWNRPMPLRQSSTFTLSTPELHAGVRVAPNGDVLALADSSADDYLNPISKLVRLDADGNTIATTALTGMPDATFVGATQLSVLSDSSALLTTFSGFSSSGSDGVTAIGSGASSGTVMHLDRNGNPLSSPFDAASVPSNGQLVNSFVASDGTSYLLTQYPYDQVNDFQNGVVQAARNRYAISRIAADGVKVWKTEFEGYWYTATLSATSDRVCIGGSFGPYHLFFLSQEIPAASEPETRVECHSTLSGAKLYSQQLKPYRGAIAENVLISTHPEGSVSAAIELSGSSPSIFQLDATGHIAHSSDVALEGYLASMASDGSISVVEDAQTLARIAADGTVAYSKSLDGVDNILGVFYTGDTSTLIETQSADGSGWIRSISTEGAIVWSTQVITAAENGVVGVGAYADGSGSVAIALLKSSATQILVLDASNGAIRMQTSSPLTGNGSFLRFDPSTHNVIQVAFYDHKFGFAVIDVSSGAVGEPHYFKCGSADCSAVYAQDAEVDSHGIARVLFAPFPNTFGPEVPQIVGVDVSEAPAIAAAQSGVSGVWYAPYETGQGFIIDYIAGAHILFIPWFTYTQTGGNDPAQLIWYSFQGSVSTGATSAALILSTAEGGVFNSGKISGHPVGTGNVTFTDCDHGSLDYVFDPDVNGGASGTISISRLGPALATCAVQGVSFTGSAIVAPSNGFDSNQSGSWYNADTTGQGVEFTITPATATSSGFLFGAWFTFDPPNAADDATQQHWFSLQSDLSTALNGKIDVPILSALGGSLDGAPTSNAMRVGTATVTFIGCAEATVQYAFDDSPLAHAYRKLSGSMHLTKIGGCSARSGNNTRTR
jgi:hypothetical protein